MRVLGIAMLPLIAAAILPSAPVRSASLETEKTRQADGSAIRSQLQAWDESLLEGNYEALARVLSNDYFKSEGLTQEQYSEMFKQMGVTYTDSTRDNLEIRFYGDTAIVSGQWTSRGTTGQFGSFTSTSRMTDVWVKQDGNWKCVAVVPDETRKAFARIGQVRLGPDVPAEVVILFGIGVANEEIEAFRIQHLSEDSDPRIPIVSYTRPTSIDEHVVVTLKLGKDVSDTERKFFVERLLKDPIVFRVFENIAPDRIDLDE